MDRPLHGNPPAKISTFPDISAPFNFVMSGYMGGVESDANYQSVCSGMTQHVEVVKVTYDSSVINTNNLLRIFFSIHDPTTLDKQGADIGPQYRSIIYYDLEEQKLEAKAIIKELNDEAPTQRPVVTKLEPAKIFFPAEEYHLNYYDRNQSQPYCQYVIDPKLKNFIRDWPENSKPTN